MALGMPPVTEIFSQLRVFFFVFFCFILLFLWENTGLVLTEGWRPSGTLE